MPTETYVAKVVRQNGEWHVTVPQLDHIILVSQCEADMLEQTRHWISEMQSCEKDSFEIRFEYEAGITAQRESGKYSVLIELFDQKSIKMSAGVFALKELISNESSFMAHANSFC